MNYSRDYWGKDKEKTKRNQQIWNERRVDKNTAAEIGRRHGISDERVRQIVEKIDKRGKEKT